MKVGLSTYSLYGAIHKGEMDVLSAIDWIAENGGEHVEIVPFGFELTTEKEVEEVREKAARASLEISSYTIGAQFIQDTEEAIRAEIERVKREVDIAQCLGVRLMRHDVATRPIPEATIQNFMADLPKLADACREISDYAAERGITTSVENHGYYLQHSDRVQLLLHTVDRSNFKTTLDAGNFLCVDEDPLSAVKKNIGSASMVHLKDFYVRSFDENPGEDWFPTSGGRFLRGAIVGHGDIDIPAIVSTIKTAGYDGFISIEFEGLEDCREGSRIGMENVRKMWSDA